MIPESLHRFLSIPNHGDARAFVAKQPLGNLRIQLIVLRQQQAQPRDIRRHARLFAPLLFGDFKGKRDDKNRPLSFFARYADIAAHFIRKAFGDGHTESRPLIHASRVAVFLRKRLEDVLQKSSLMPTPVSLIVQR